jgi:hypothetical protein
MDWDSLSSDSIMALPLQSTTCIDLLDLMPINNRFRCHAILHATESTDRVRCYLSSVTLQGRVTPVLLGTGDGDAEVVCVPQSLVAQELVDRFVAGEQ